MFRIDHPTAAAVLPAAAPAGTPGYFQGGNPATSTPRTVVTQDWANAVQEEIASVVLGAGLALSKTNNGQLLAAVNALIAGAGAVSLQTSGYITFPDGLILQWGQGVTATGNTDVVFFPASFSNGVFCVLACERNAAGWTANAQAQAQPTIYGTTPRNLSSFLISCARILVSGQPIYQGGDAFSYFAIGH